MPPEILFSIIVPVFNEEGALPELQERLHKVMEGLGAGYEIVYVDDGSKDSSPEVLKKLKDKYPGLKIISFKKNKGKWQALIAGFTSAKGEWIITVDADLQNPPEEIPKLLCFKDKFDYIIGMRINRKDDIVKKISSIFARSARRIVLGDITKDVGCCLRVFKKKILKSIPFFRNFYLYMPFLAGVKGFSVKEVGIEHCPRKSGRSKYGVLKRGWQGIFDLWRVSQLKKRI